MTKNNIDKIMAIIESDTCYQDGFNSGIQKCLLNVREAILTCEEQGIISHDQYIAIYKQIKKETNM